MVNIMLKEELVDLLIKKKLKISFAESCTGGLLASEIVSVANASYVLDSSYVTYANQAKMDLLGVKEATIKRLGVVSEEVALEMALGLKELSKADIAVSTSGIAGPTGGTKEKPVGTVCIGIIIKDKAYSFKKKFKNYGRNYIRRQTVDFIFSFLIEELNK